MMWWSKCPVVYIIKFYLAKQVFQKKTESGRHTRGPQATWARPGGGRAQVACGHLVGPLGYFLFWYFFNIPK